MTTGEFRQIDLEGFSNAISGLRSELRASLGADDLRHLRRIERWGRAATAIGLATAWIAPNPLSAAAMSLGRSTRWLLMHHVGHRGYDRVPGVARRHTSKVFARGRRRLLDWADWMLPEAWIYEHNVLHHQHTGDARDPDLIEENVASLAPLPRFARYGLLALLAATWRASYYAPKTLAAWSHRFAKPGAAPAAAPLGKLVLECYTPYLLLNFVALPLAFAAVAWALGFADAAAWVATSVLVNSLLADVLTNVHTFVVVGPNHSGDDVWRFDGDPASRGEFYLRQVTGSVNYRTGGDLCDFAHLWLNYQIEHHLFPDMPMLAYRRVQPQVKSICERYGVPYLQEPVTVRFAKMSRVFVGKAKMRRYGEAVVEGGDEGIAERLPLADGAAA